VKGVGATAIEGPDTCCSAATATAATATATAQKQH